MRQGVSHKHTFTALWARFGPFGRGDVHYHPCVHGDLISGPFCDRVLVGPGRDCDGKPETHHRETLRAS